MKEIGAELRETRKKTGLSLKEVSDDLKIKELILENIEDGNIGCFKDVFVLKNYISLYAKYLGLEEKKLLNMFNEYLFEYTSKIPVVDIEKAIQDQQKEKELIDKNKIASPYTMTIQKKSAIKYYLIGGFLVIILIIIVVWAIKLIV